MTKAKPFFHVIVDFSQPQSHRAKVSLRSMQEALPGILEFPVWTPGSYFVRDYSRHITKLEPATKVAKNRWRLETGAASVSYEVYCFDRTVRTSFVDENYAVLVGASLLPLLRGPFTVELRLPASWKLVSSALQFHRKGPGRWLASVRDDDHWIDCPIVAAAPGFGGVGKFSIAGIPHYIAWVGLECARSMKDMEVAFQKIAGATLKFFGGSPFKEYFFLLHFGHKLYGGLEHRNSQLSQFDGSALSEAKEWDKFLKLVAHEYFHSWNVKSLRPKALGPFDYSQENYTQDLWFAEGLTDYFDDMIPHQARLFSTDAYWRARLKDATILPDGIPAHERRSLTETSFDAWIRAYRPDEDSINTDVSYYTKGALLGWCWDAHLQKKSKGKWTLARLMKAFWKEFGIDAYEPLATARAGFTREELFTFAEKITKIPQRALVEAWLQKRKPLPWRQAAAQFGVNVVETISDPALHFLGCQIQWSGGKGVVQKVLSNTAAEKAGLSPHDEILAVNGLRVTDPEKFQQTLKQARAAGKEIKILFCRLDKIFTRSLRWRKHASIGVEYGMKT